MSLLKTMPQYFKGVFAISILLTATSLITACNLGNNNIPTPLQNGNYVGTFSPGIYNPNLQLESFNLVIA